MKGVGKPLKDLWLSEGTAKAALRSLVVSERSSKATAPCRLAALDDALQAELSRQVAGGEALAVHDMAASTGITSLELYRKLSSIWPVAMRVSDRFNYVARHRAFGCDVYFDVLGRPVQCAFGNLGIYDQRGPLRWALRTIASLARSAPEVDRIALFDPEVLAAQGPHFQLASDDLLNPDPGSYQVVRIANALIPQTHAAAEIIRALEAIAPIVAPGGLLLVGQWTRSRQAASIFLREGDRFVELRKLGAGYACASPLLAWRKRPPGEAQP